MQENYIVTAFRKSRDLVETMKADAKRGTIIKEIYNHCDNSIVRIIEVSEGNYIYTLTHPSSLKSSNEPYFYARSSYLIPELVSRTPSFAYGISNASIRRSLKGIFMEYICDDPYDEFAICYGGHNDMKADEKIHYTQALGSSDPKVPLFFFMADFAMHTIHYAALAEAKREEKKTNVRIEVRRLMSDGNPNLDDDIRPFQRRFGALSGMEELERRRELAEAIFSDLYRIFGLPYKVNSSGEPSLEAQMVRYDIFGAQGLGNDSYEPEYTVDDEPEYTVDDEPEYIVDDEPEYIVDDGEPIHFLSEGNDMPEDDLVSLKKQLDALYKYLDKIRKTGNEKMITVIQEKIDVLEAKLNNNNRTRR